MTQREKLSSGQEGCQSALIKHLYTGKDGSSRMGPAIIRKCRQCTLEHKPNEMNHASSIPLDLSYIKKMRWVPLCQAPCARSSFPALVPARAAAGSIPWSPPAQPAACFCTMFPMLDNALVRGLMDIHAVNRELLDHHLVL